MRRTYTNRTVNMKTYKYIFLSFLSAVSLLLPTSLYGKHYIYKQIQLGTGLPTTLNCISSDTKGFIWTGTKFGLGRFDGHEQKRYTHKDDDDNSLPGNYIYQIIEDSLHNLWILTDRGVARYNYNKDSFSILKNPQGKTCMAYSACIHGQNVILGGTNEVYSYDNKTKTLKMLYELPCDERFEIARLAVTQSGYLLCCSRWQGIYTINLKSGKTDSSRFGCGKEISDLYIDSKQRIWIAPYYQGLRCFSPDGKLIASYRVDNSRLSNDIVLCITERDGQIWLGTDGGGINILDVEKNRFSHLKHTAGDKLYSLPTNSINCLYCDQYDNIWMGGVYNGLINMREVSMKTYSDVPLGYPFGLSHNIAISLYEGKDGQVWVGTDGGGINRFDSATETFTHYPPTVGDKVTSICDFTQSRLIYSAFAEGIFIFNPADGTKTPFQVIDENTSHTISQRGYSVYLHRNTPNTILFLSNHLYIYHIKENTFSIAREEKENPISWGSLQAISSDANQTYLFDSRRIFILDHATSSLKTLYIFPRAVTVNSVAYDRNGHFWIGTNYGLKRLDLSSKEVTSIETSLFTDVSTVLFHTPDKILIGAENMLFSYSPQKKRFILYGESDGVLPNEYIPRAQLVLNDKSVCLGGVKGLLYISDDHKADVVSHPELQLSDIIVNGKSVNGKMKRHQDMLSISRNSNVAIQIMAKEEDIFRQRLYRFRIEGLDNTYTETYQPEFIMRTQMPGTYKVLASCTAKDGSWIPDKKILTVTILPLWYQTWWFTSGCVTIFILGVAFLFRRTYKQKERKLQWAMKEHERQVYEEKVRFLINISHELRTPLTLICAPLKRILKSINADNDQYQPLKAIYRQSVRMKSIINMVLDVRKMEVGENKLHLYPYPFNEWLQLCVQDFINESEAGQVTIRCKFDPQIKDISFDKDKCNIILSNLLMNALKHSPQNSVITVSSEMTGQYVRVSISDQGTGLNVDKEKLFKRFYQGEGEQEGTGIGLSYSKILVEQHGGKISAYNNEKKGATFYFTLPVRHENEEIVSPPKAYLNELITSDDTVQSSDTENFNTSAYRILIAEDQPEMREFLQTALKDFFKETIAASNGEDALRLTKEHMPDIVISDVMMPRMNGYQLCQHIKEDINISHIPVILLTARDDEQSQKEGYKNGADAYLTKPFEEDTLMELIRNRLKDKENMRKRYLQTGSIPVPEESTYSKADEIFLLRLNKIILDNLDNCNLDIATVCQEMHMSRASFYNKLKALTGIGGNEYINKLRMEKAIKLITSTTMPFSEIAEKVGFATSSYFSTAFKQYTGKTPTQYKKEGMKPQEGPSRRAS